MDLEVFHTSSGLDFEFWRTTQQQLDRLRVGLEPLSGHVEELLLHATCVSHAAARVLTLSCKFCIVVNIGENTLNGVANARTPTVNMSLNIF